MFGNLLVYFVILKVGLSPSAIFAEIRSIEDLAAPAFLSVVVGILNAQLKPVTKARIVFLRWKNALPGSRAFSEFMDDDPRISPEELTKLVSPLPSSPKDQNRLWYKWYQDVSAIPSTNQANREYLFTRDWATISVLFILFLGPLGWNQMPQLTFLAYFGILLAQFILVRNAAKNHGERLVCTVLALKSVGK